MSDKQKPSNEVVIKKIDDLEILIRSEVAEMRRLVMDYYENRRGCFWACGRAIKAY